MIRLGTIVGTVIVSYLLAAAPVAAESGRSVYSLDQSWTSDAGKEVRLADEAQNPTVITLVYTRCKSACPITMGRLKTLHGLLQKEGLPARFVLVSMDAAKETNESLAAFRRQYKLGDDWVLLRGSDNEIRTLSVALGMSYREESKGGEFIHSNKIAVLDRTGEVRGVLDGLKSEVSELVPVVREAGKSAASE